MKKLKKKLPLVLVALGLFFFGIYQYFKNYVDPGLFDKDYQCKPHLLRIKKKK